MAIDTGECLSGNRLHAVEVKKVKKGIAVCRQACHHRYGNSHAMGSHSVTCHPTEVTFPHLPQPKLVLDLATQEGCKAELTYVVG